MRLCLILTGCTMPLEKLSRVYGVEKVTHNILSGKLSIYEMINVNESKIIR